MGFGKPRVRFVAVLLSPDSLSSTSLEKGLHRQRSCSRSGMTSGGKNVKERERRNANRAV